jgi:nucleoside-diphosphate-sugar epimerase
MTKISIIGLGWFGMELANSLKSEYEVIGSKRIVPVEQPDNLHILPLDINAGDWELQIRDLLKANVVLLNIPPSGTTSKDEFVFKSKRIIDLALQSSVEHFIFISSTGVFSNNREIVDENSLPDPETKNGNCLLDIESYLSEQPFQHKHIIRPGGLVGGKRHPIFYLAGRKNVSGRFHPVNLVHRKDLIELTKAVVKTKPPQLILHAVSPEHPGKEDYYKKAAEYFQLALPEFSDDSSKGKKVLSELTAKSLDFTYHFQSPMDMLSSIQRL